MDVRYMSKKREVSVPAGAIEAKDWRLASSSLQADLSAARTWCGGRGSFWLAVLPKGGTHMASRQTWAGPGGRARWMGRTEGESHDEGEGGRKEARFNNRAKNFANCERTG